MHTCTSHPWQMATTALTLARARVQTRTHTHTHTHTRQHGIRQTSAASPHAARARRRGLAASGMIQSHTRTEGNKRRAPGPRPSSIIAPRPRPAHTPLLVVLCCWRTVSRHLRPGSICGLKVLCASNAMPCPGPVDNEPPNLVGPLVVSKFRWTDLPGTSTAVNGTVTCVNRCQRFRTTGPVSANSQGLKRGKRAAEGQADAARARDCFRRLCCVSGDTTAANYN